MTHLAIIILTCFGPLSEPFDSCDLRALLLQVLNDVQDFLRIPQMELKSRQVKIHKGPLHEQVENWDDIRKVLNGTPYENFLHEDYKVS